MADFPETVFSCDWDSHLGQEGLTNLDRTLDIETREGESNMEYSMRICEALLKTSPVSLFDMYTMQPSLKESHMENFPTSEVSLTLPFYSFCRSITSIQPGPLWRSCLASLHRKSSNPARISTL